MKDYLLCRDCEQRFSINGEKYVMALVTKRSGQFPLLEMLDKIATPAVQMKVRGYTAAMTPNIDRANLAYFALSVFWRASVHRWREHSGKTVHIELGRKYNEELRKYLLGLTGIPKHANLLVAACSDLDSQRSFFMPGENVKVKDHSVAVMVRGLFFLLRMTRTPAPWQQRLSMINSPGEWISVWDCFARGVWRLGEHG